MTISFRCGLARRLFKLTCVCLLMAMCGTLSLVKAGPQGPILLSEPDSTRAIALDATTFTREPFAATAAIKFGADQRTRIMLFAMNLDLLPNELTDGNGIEDCNKAPKAFTAEAEDSLRRRYALTVECVRRVPEQEWMYAVVLRLNDSMGNLGDVLININLHGVASNRVRVAIGHKGGGPPDDSSAVATPAPAVLPSPIPTPTVPPLRGPASTADVVRFLEQATFGPTSAEVARVRSIGFRAYLNEQFAAPMSSYPTLTLMPTDQNTGCPSGSPSTCGRDNYTMYPLQMRFFQNALNTQPGNDQLRQRVAFALHQIFVVSGRDVNQPSWMAPYLQTLDRNAFGNFRQLLYEITLNPAMGNYLDMAGNNKNNPNENYAREILQLFSVGLDKLNPDGTPQLDANGNRIPTYDQATITHFARVFTGWVIPGVPGQAGVPDYINPMVVTRETNHDTGQKVLLNGAVLPAGQTSAKDLNDAIDNIFNHSNVGPFIGKQLIQHLVTSNPSSAYVERVAAAFNNNCSGLYPDSPCSGARGDMKAVITAILLDPEARGDAKTAQDYGHLREPALFITNILRACEATSDGYLNPNSVTLEQDVFRPPTVFNYFPADYVVPGTDLSGPEFGILSTSTALRRANFVNTILFNGIAAGTNAPTGTPALTLPALQPLADDPSALVEELNRLMLHGTMSKTMRNSIVQAMSSVPTTDASYKLKRARMAVYLVATSSQYQVEK